MHLSVHSIEGVVQYGHSLRACLPSPVSRETQEVIPQLALDATTNRTMLPCVRIVREKKLETQSVEPVDVRQACCIPFDLKLPGIFFEIPGGFHATIGYCENRISVRDDDRCRE